MLAIEPHPAFFLAIGFIIGLAVFIGTLVAIWTQRTDRATRLAAGMATVSAVVVALPAPLVWVMVEEKPFVPFGSVLLPALCFVPASVIAFYCSLVWLQRAAIEPDRG